MRQRSRNLGKMEEEEEGVGGWVSDREATPVLPMQAPCIEAEEEEEEEEEELQWDFSVKSRGDLPGLEEEGR